MIFVTVGTHEQPFDRLVKGIDDLKGLNIVREEVIIQTGFSSYIPKHCLWSQWYSYEEMADHVEKARIVITHGGPSSFMMPLQLGKVPIVAPRQKRFGEHVNDHQVDFVRLAAERYGNILVLENMEELKDMLLDYERLAASKSVGMESNNARFNRELGKIADELMAGKQ